MKVRELMAPAPATTSSHSSISEAIFDMSGSNSVLLAVVDGDRPVGVVTDIDLARASQQGCELVRDIMSSPVIAVTITDEGEEALRLMVAHHVRHLLVLVGFRVAGMVSLSDLLTRLPSSDTEWAAKHLTEHNRRSEPLGSSSSNVPYFG